jgi:hypothetical protein
MDPDVVSFAQVAVIIVMMVGSLLAERWRGRRSIDKVVEAWRRWGPDRPPPPLKKP